MSNEISTLISNLTKEEKLSLIDDLTASIREEAGIPKTKKSKRAKGSKGSEVQKHGFIWQKELQMNVYGATEDELKNIPYTSESDLPRALNRKDDVNLSIKTTGSENAICMGDCIRVYDAVSSGNPHHMTVVLYKQCDDKKTLASIIEVNLINSVKLLFGSITKDQLLTLDKAVKAVPRSRSPTPEEHKHMYSIRNSLLPMSGAIYLNIKCDSKQSRLQCSFNRFQKFLKENPDRIIEQSTSGSFRGGNVLEVIESGSRVFTKTVPAPDSAPHSPPP